MTRTTGESDVAWSFFGVLLEDLNTIIYTVQAVNNVCKLQLLREEQGSEDVRLEPSSNISDIISRLRFNPAFTSLFVIGQRIKK